MEQKNYDNLAIASLIVGVLNLCAWLLPLCGLPLSLVGLALGVMGLRSSQRRLAMIGIALCVLGLLLGLGNTILAAYLGPPVQLFQQ
jgi:hypothetical protein